MRDLWERYPRQCLIALVIVLIGASLLMSRQSAPTTSIADLAESSTASISGSSLGARDSLTSANKPTTNHAGNRLFVDVKGEVAKPGVYPAQDGMRVKDVIALAGGVTPRADAQQVNFAQKVTDQQMIEIPRKGHTNQGTTTSGTNHASGPATPTDKINLNVATKEQLQTLDGIGEKKAEKIVDFRETKGPFKSVDALQQVPGFGEKTVARLKDHLTVN